MADYFTHFSCLLDVGTPQNAARALDLYNRLSEDGAAEDGGALWTSARPDASPPPAKRGCGRAVVPGPVEATPPTGTPPGIPLPGIPPPRTGAPENGAPGIMAEA